MLANKAKFNLEDLYVLFGRENLYNFDNSIEIEGISIDSRTITEGNGFVAIKGENSDGHSKVLEAISKGAKLAFVDKNWYLSNQEDCKNFPVITYKDVYSCLGDLANHHRNRFHIPVVAVAGSNGKTTTKEMIASILSQKYKVLKTYKNFNNQLGVPLMLFQLDESYGAAVIEIGTNSFGEIAKLSKIVNPNHAIITNIGKEHLEELIDIDGVEFEETNLFSYAKKHDVFSYINMDDERLKKYPLVIEKSVTYGFTKLAMVSGELEYDSDLMPIVSINFNSNQFKVKANVPGYPGAINTLAASAVALNLDLSNEDVIKGIESYVPDSESGYGRLSVINKSKVKIINDTYNANPGSVSEMINLVSTFKDKKNIHIVLGDMLELGKSTDTEHQNIYEKAKEVTTHIYTFGAVFRKIDKNLNFEDKNELTSSVLNNLKDNDIILVKGSRGMKMEEVVQNLLNNIN